MISQRITGGNVSFYNYDGHGSVRQLTNQSGAITDTYTYDAFGNLINRTGTTPNDYLYAGEQFDANLGFYYLRARYMNPSNGRFHSMDSYEGNEFEPITFHKYLYANSSPSVFTDPSGNFSIVEVSIANNIRSTLSGFTDLQGQAIISQVRDSENSGLVQIAIAALVPVGIATVFKSTAATLRTVARIQGRTVRKIGAYGRLTNYTVAGTQAHHINQDAAFKSVIPSAEGVAVELKGWYSGSEHSDFHRLLNNQLWKDYKIGGRFAGTTPTCQQYDEAIRQVFRQIGLDAREADALADMAREQRLLYGLNDSDFVPRVPGT